MMNWKRKANTSPQLSRNLAINNNNNNINNNNNNSNNNNNNDNNNNNPFDLWELIIQSILFSTDALIEMF